MAAAGPDELAVWKAALNRAHAGESSGRDPIDAQLDDVLGVVRQRPSLEAIAPPMGRAHKAAPVGGGEAAFLAAMGCAPALPSAVRHAHAGEQAPSWAWQPAAASASAAAAAGSPAPQPCCSSAAAPSGSSASATTAATTSTAASACSAGSAGNGPGGPCTESPRASDGHTLSSSSAPSAASGAGPAGSSRACASQHPPGAGADAFEAVGELLVPEQLPGGRASMLAADTMPPKGKALVIENGWVGETHDEDADPDDAYVPSFQ